MLGFIHSSHRPESPYLYIMELGGQIGTGSSQNMGLMESMEIRERRADSHTFHKPENRPLAAG